MKKLHFLFTVLILLVTASFSQNTHEKVIIDAKTKFPIDYVYVNSDGNRINLMSNSEGRLILTADPKTKSFTFYKIGYYPKTVSVEDLALTDSVFLKEKSVTLSEVTITTGVLETIVKDKKYYVDDYLVLPNKDFLLITSVINIEAFEVSYYKKDKGITCKKRFTNEEGEYLFTDCFKNIHLVTKNFSRQIVFTSDSSFDFLHRYTRAKFDSTLANCVLKVDTQLIFKIYPPPVKVELPNFSYMQNATHLTYMKVYKKKRDYFYTLAFNERLMEMYKNEVSDKLHSRQNISLVGGRGQCAEADESQIEYFFRKVAKPIYAPVFLVKDTVIIFNFEEGVIVFLNKEGKLLNEVKLKDKEISTFHDFEILYDPTKIKFYFKTKEFDKSVLSSIDIYSGSVKEKIHLEKIFAKNIQVLNDKLYYLVKEKEWDDTCYLYQQNL
ncbi:hypothetical protein CNR22_11145 [Sphingobacteriaceae bacterium]|nr:hypothetical protein CNR22_11145 [Sphingobacteriaceae bacterium]